MNDREKWREMVRDIRPSGMMMMMMMIYIYIYMCVCVCVCVRNPYVKENIVTKSLFF